jgi:hypothetical protein
LTYQVLAKDRRYNSSAVRRFWHVIHQSLVYPNIDREFGLAGG